MSITRDHLVLQAVANGEFTHDASVLRGIRWHGVEVEYDLYAIVHNMACDGLLDYDDERDGPVTLTAEGERELKAVVR